MENLNQMGLIIKEKRKQQEMTQKELAEKLGVSDKAVSKWERCESLPDVTLIPQIAEILEVSIEYLMTGTEKRRKAADGQTERADTEKAQTVASAAAVMHSKISTKYTICICILFFMLLSGLFVIAPFAKYIPWDFYDLFTAAASIALYMVFYMHCRTGITMLDSLGAKYTGGTGTVAALTAAGNVLVLIFLGVQRNGHNSLIAAMLGLTVINYEDNILWGDAGYGWLLLLVVMFAAVVINLFFSKDKNYFDKNVIAVFAGGTVMCVAHRMFFEFIEKYIVSQQQFLYGFYLGRQPAITVIGNIERYTLIYLAVIAVFAAVAGAVFSKDAKQKLVTAAVMVAFAVYMYLSADRFLGFEAYGRYYAQLTAYGAKDSVVITAALPHIVMILNRFTKDKNRYKKAE